jgi:peptide/nickel transport system permease protein
MRPKSIDRAFAPLYALLVLWALVGGLPRLGTLIPGDPTGTDTAVHSILALLGILVAGMGIVGALRPERPAVAAPTPMGDLVRQFRKNRAAVLGFHGVMAMALLTVLAPLLTPYDPIAQGLPRGVPPGTSYWLGTDDLGRDVLARCLFGARISMTVGFLAVALSASLGTLVGAAAGYVGGFVDRALMWATDLLLAMPRLILLIVIVGLYRPSGSAKLFLLVTTLGVTGWMGVARIVRSQVLSIKELDYVAAARSLGVPSTRILLRHVIPNVTAPIIVYASLALGGTILTEAALSFLGLGVSPPTATWGKMIADGYESWRAYPWVVLFPGLFIVVAVVSLNLLGDGLRDALDPKVRGRT